MKYYKLNILILFLFSLSLQAQEVILTSGGNASGSGGTVSYSIGQTFYTTYTGANGSASHGVQHPYETLIETITMEFNRPMTNGWNWFSVYLVSEDMELDHILDFLNPQAGDYIKDRKGSGNSSTYYDGGGFTGWFPTLELDPKETYKMKLGNAGDLIYQGSPVDIANMEILVNIGWNWIGYPISVQMSVGDYLSTLDKVENDYIKDQLNSSTFYGGYGWYGNLEMMEPGNGYVMKVANDGSIHKPDAVSFKERTINISEGVEIDFPRYNVNVRDFEFSGSATIEVFVDGSNKGAEENILYAFNQDDICVGIINGLRYPINNKYLYNLMMYSNLEEDDDIHFKFLDKAENKWYSFEEKLTFNEDMIVADAYHPFELRQTIAADLNHNGIDIKVYPNPFTNTLTYSFKVIENSNVHISVIDASGKIIEVLKDQLFSKGQYSFEWNKSNLPEGMYYLRIEMDGFDKTTPIVKMN